MGFGWGGAAATAAATPVFVEGVIVAARCGSAGAAPE